MKIIQAATKTVQYNVYIGNNILNELNAIISSLHTNRLVIVTDQQIAMHYLQLLQKHLVGYIVDVVILEAGEQHKGLASVCKIIDALVQKHHDRHSTLISIGGGLIGDVTGFAASIYMRGMHWVQIPTTLLAQVDASVGGKTGCNYAGVKNLIGTFYQPSLVVIDSLFLNSLPAREYNAGLAEIIKYGIACDKDFFVWLEKNIKQLRDRYPDAVLTAIEQCCRTKLRIVELDEHDHGGRMALNFGHTFAHALEAATDFKYYLHGEAVAIGMLLATELAVKLEQIELSILQRLEKMLSCIALPLQLDFELYSVEQLCKLMLHDKKKRGDGINLILPCALGAVRVVNVNKIECIEELFKDYVSS